MADNVAITAGTGTPIATDDVGGVQFQKIKIDVGGDGVSLPLSASNPIPVSVTSATVSNAGTFPTQETGAALASLQAIDDLVLAEDAPAVNGDKGIQLLAVRKDSIATTVSTDGDYSPLQVTASGSLRVAIAEDAIGSTLDTDDGTIASGQANVALTASLNHQFTGTAWVRETVVAHDAVDSGSPQKIGGYAITALPTAVSNADRANVITDKFGRQVIVHGTIRDLIGTQTTTISASTAETTIVTAAASVFNDIVMLIVSNTSASTSTRIDFRDTSAGSILFSLYSVGGQGPVGFSLSRPVPQTTVNTNWTAQCSVSTTDIRIYAVFEKNR